MRRFRLSLSTFGGIVPGASHWWCRIAWREGRDYREENAERVIRGSRNVEQGGQRTQRFDTIALAQSAGLRLARKLAAGSEYVVTKGPASHLDPQEILVGPPAFRREGNKIWRDFEKLDGWSAPKHLEPKVEALQQRWDALLEKHAIE